MSWEHRAPLAEERKEESWGLNHIHKMSAKRRQRGCWQPRIEVEHAQVAVLGSRFLESSICWSAPFYFFSSLNTRAWRPASLLPALARQDTARKGGHSPSCKVLCTKLQLLSQGKCDFAQPYGMWSKYFFQRQLRRGFFFPLSEMVP